MAITKAAFTEGCGLFATPRGINQPVGSTPRMHSFEAVWLLAHQETVRIDMSPKRPAVAAHHPQMFEIKAPRTFSTPLSAAVATTPFLQIHSCGPEPASAAPCRDNP